MKHSAQTAFCHITAVVQLLKLVWKGKKSRRSDLAKIVDNVCLLRQCDEIRRNLVTFTINFGSFSGLIKYLAHRFTYFGNFLILLGKFSFL